jgi:hypothetical protein
MPALQKGKELGTIVFISTATISSISSRGGSPCQNLLFSPVEEEGASSISSNLT